MEPAVLHCHVPTVVRKTQLQRMCFLFNIEHRTLRNTILTPVGPSPACTGHRSFTSYFDWWRGGEGGGGVFRSPTSPLGSTKSCKLQLKTCFYTEVTRALPAVVLASEGHQVLVVGRERQRLHLCLVEREAGVDGSLCKVPYYDVRLNHNVNNMITQNGLKGSFIRLSWHSLIDT